MLSRVARDSGCLFPQTVLTGSAQPSTGDDPQCSGWTMAQLTGVRTPLLGLLSRHCNFIDPRDSWRPQEPWPQAGAILHSRQPFGRNTAPAGTSHALLVARRYGEHCVPQFQQSRTLRQARPGALATNAPPKGRMVLLAAAIRPGPADYVTRAPMRNCRKGVGQLAGFVEEPTEPAPAGLSP